VGKVIFGVLLLVFGSALTMQLAREDKTSASSVDVIVERCDCLIRFNPVPMLPGAGTAGDPYILKSNTVNVGVGVNGVGLVTIIDENGDVLFSYYKSTEGYEELPAQLTLPDGLHRLTAQLDGDDIKWDGTGAVFYIKIGDDGSDIDVPTTGWFGRKDNISGAVRSGVISVVLIVGLFILFAVLKKREDKRKKAEALRRRQRAIDGINPKAMEKSGAIRRARRK
jgi:hypothetical protein